MALTRLVIDGFGQIELNQVAFRRDGRIEAQCALDGTNFKDIPAENGMLLAIDRAKRTVKLPEASEEKLPLAINYSAEHMYDDRTPGLKNFKLELGTFYPRLGFLSVGDKFTTNCIAYDSEDFTDKAAIETACKDADTLSGTPVYGTYCENGAIKLVKEAPTDGPVLQVIEKTTMPDGQFGLKFQVNVA